MATAIDTAADTGADTAAAEPSIRDALSSAFDDADAAAGAASDDPPARATDGPAKAPTDEGQDGGSGERARDDKGRFAASTPKPPDATSAPAAPATPAPPGQQQARAPMPPAPAPLELRAPAAWKPQVREMWGAVPAEVRAEIHRRESEHQHTLQAAAQARQFQDAFERVVRPYEIFIRAENSTPLDAVDNLMRMAAVMRTGTPSQKVDVVANIIKQWQIDLPMLDSVVAAHVTGQPAPQFSGAQTQAFRDPRLDQLLAAQHQQAQDNMRNMQAELTREVEAFAANPKNEFFEDVRAVMSDLIAMAAKRGEAMTMDQAYAKACQLDDNVSKILSQRASARQASANTNAALRARRAAASVRGDTTLNDGATVPRDDSIRASLEAAFDESERHRR